MKGAFTTTHRPPAPLPANARPQQARAEEEPPPAPSRHLDLGFADRRGVGEAVNDRSPHVPAVAPHPPRPVQAREPGPAIPLQRRDEPLEPARVPHLGVVVQEADELAPGEPPPLVQGAHETEISLVR